MYNENGVQFNRMLFKLYLFDYLETWKCLCYVNAKNTKFIFIIKTTS